MRINKLIYKRRYIRRVILINIYPKAVEYIDAIHNDVDKLLKNRGDNFTVSLLKLIDKKNVRDIDCYKKAGVSRQTWYQIMNDANYIPSKKTVLAFAISLELNIADTEALLKTAGYSFSNCNVNDVIFKYFITNKIYDFCTINETLQQFDKDALK